jgi:pyruvate dehydrogenase phosphatase
MDTKWGTRVLGAIAITRGSFKCLFYLSFFFLTVKTSAVGDQHFKMSREWIDVWLRVRQIKFSYTTTEAWKARILTPPYLSNVADVRHVKLDPTQGANQRILILSSDGLYDLRPEEQMETPVAPYGLEWVKAAAKASGRSSNIALEVLKRALGGDDEAKVSAMLTLEYEGRWTDDITVIARLL